MGSDNRWCAFQGANGWYVAREGADGFHRQPSNGGTLGEREARREARRRNRGTALDAMYGAKE